MASSFSGIIETIENCDLDTFLSNRTKALAAHTHLGAHDVIVVQKTYVRSGLLHGILGDSPSSVYWHTCIGLEIDPSFICSHIHSLLKSQEPAPITYRGEYKINKVVMATYDPISRSDLRVAVQVPGSTALSAVQVDSLESSDPTDEQWRNAALASFCRYSLPLNLPSTHVLYYNYKYEANIINDLKSSMRTLQKIGIWRNNKIIDSNHPVLISLFTYFSTSSKYKTGSDLFYHVSFECPAALIFWLKFQVMVDKFVEGLSFTRNAIQNIGEDGPALPYLWASFANVLFDYYQGLVSAGKRDNSSEVKEKSSEVLKECLQWANDGFVHSQSLYCTLALAQPLAALGKFSTSLTLLNQSDEVSSVDNLLFMNDAPFSQLVLYKSDDESSFTSPATLLPFLSIALDWVEEVESQTEDVSDSLDGFKKSVYDFFIKVVHLIGYPAFEMTVSTVFPDFVKQTEQESPAEEEEKEEEKATDEGEEEKEMKEEDEDVGEDAETEGETPISRHKLLSDDDVCEIISKLHIEDSTEVSRPSDLLSLVLHSIFFDIKIYNDWRLEEGQRKHDLDRSSSRRNSTSDSVGSLSSVSSKNALSLLPDTVSFNLWMKRGVVSTRLLYFNEAVYAFRTATGLCFSLKAWVSLADIFARTGMLKETLICLNVVVKKYFRIMDDYSASDIVQMVGCIPNSVKRPFYRCVARVGLQEVFDEMLTISDLSPLLDIFVMNLFEIRLLILICRYII
ncbi:hypothetical protein GEMRC1_004963 [Eukaryota sp. GEM-RC1]